MCYNSNLYYYNIGYVPHITMSLKTLFSVVLFSALFLLNTTLAQAVVTPTFSSCLNPQGDIKVSYSSGTHGVVGNTAEYTGSDTVYILSSDTHIQCFCSENGEGIQTNWWKISSLSDTDIQVLKNQGWFFVPNGALWGLDSSSYLAQNSDYACRGAIGGTGGTGGSVLGISTDVLGLATTGNSMTIFILFIVGGISTVLGFRFRNSARKLSR